MNLIILILVFLAAGSFLAGAGQFLSVSSGRRQVVQAVMGDDYYAGADRLERADRVFRATSVGRRLEREMILAGVDRRPVVVFGAGVGVGLAAALGLWALLAPLFGVIGVLAGLVAVRTYLRRERSRRLEAFIAQMPELARVLANATNAGLSISTAVATAGAELAEPARTEMLRISERVGFGVPMETALRELQERLESREVAVLTATLVVSARSGGSLVSALREIADTLEMRKETRREVRTTLAQSVITGYLVLGIGFLILVGLNFMYPGSVRQMTTQLVGQIALAIAGILATVGMIMIRKLTRIEA
ncbi:type II secretion system F family protein [Kineosporia sp. J2-2]|uniref:Type II secretion system F family protein n=1 Tax=Kineosporia corallincola TaxID=2835133 RepID=A0ABS5TQT4_9ACTN|nr:type II secretion system F family protein [Kineosporia corallincola]MBT0772633.1 type II secretion system F family protein [Kineosporia corallincola]